MPATEATDGVPEWVRRFDHTDPEFTAAPEQTWHRLRAEQPVARSEAYGGMAVLSRWQEIADVAFDTEAFTSRRVFVSAISTASTGLILPPINLDPPAHTAARRVMLPFFNPRRVAGWEPHIRDICARHIAAISHGDGRCDAADDYAKHIPGEVTAAMLGLPVAEGDTFRAWIVNLVEVGATDPAVQRATTAEVVDYLTHLVRRRRAGEDPGTEDDAVAHLMAQEIHGEPIDDRDLVRMLMLLLVAGIDTTWSSISAALLHLGRHHADRDRLVHEPELIPTAVEELLRVYAPVSVARIATADAEVAGVHVPKGHWVYLGYPSACRDEAIFEDPARIRIDRQANRHAAFGLGVHRCLGSNLARLEMRIAIEMWLEAFARFTVDDTQEVAWSPGQIRGPRNVPVILFPDEPEPGV